MTPFERELRDMTDCELVAVEIQAHNDLIFVTGRSSTRGVKMPEKYKRKAEAVVRMIENEKRRRYG